MRIPDDIREAAEAAWQPTSLECKQAIARAILAERKRCIGHVYGQAGSDNVAQRTVKAIESGQ